MTLKEQGLNHCVKSVGIRSYFWSLFSVTGLNTDMYGVNLRIQCEYWKIRTRNDSVFGHFSGSEFLDALCSVLSWPSCSISYIERKYFALIYSHIVTHTRLMLHPYWNKSIDLYCKSIYWFLCECNMK